MNILIQNTGKEFSVQSFSPAMGTTGSVKGNDFTSLLAGLIGKTGSSDDELTYDIVAPQILNKLSVVVNLPNAVSGVNKTAMVQKNPSTGNRESVTGSEIAAYLVVEGDDGESIALPVGITVAECSDTDALPDETMTNSNPVIIVTIHQPSITNIPISLPSGISGENGEEINVTANQSLILDSIISNRAAVQYSPATLSGNQLSVLTGTMKINGSSVSIKDSYPLQSNKPHQLSDMNQPIVDNAEVAESMDVSLLNERSLPEITLTAGSTSGIGIGESHNIPDSGLSSLIQRDGISIQNKLFDSTRSVMNLSEVKEYISSIVEMSSVEESTVSIAQNNLIKGNTFNVSLPDKFTALKLTGEHGRDNTGFVLHSKTGNTSVQIIPVETMSEENPILRLLNTMASNSGNVEAVFTIGNGLIELQPEGTGLENINHELITADGLINGEGGVENSPAKISENFSEVIPGVNRVRLLSSEVAKTQQSAESEPLRGSGSDSIFSENAVDEIPETEGIDADTGTQEPVKPQNIDELPNLNTVIVREQAGNKLFEGKSTDTRIRSTVPPSSGDINRMADDSQSVRTILSSHDTTDDGSETRNIVTGRDQSSTGETGQFEIRIQKSDISPRATGASVTSEEQSISPMTDSNQRIFENENIPVMKNLSTMGEIENLTEEKPINKPYIHETFRVRQYSETASGNNPIDNQTLPADDIQTTITDNLTGDSETQNSESGNAHGITDKAVSTHRNLSSNETSTNRSMQFITKTVRKAEGMNHAVSSDSEKIKSLHNDITPDSEIPDAELHTYMTAEDKTDKNTVSFTDKTVAYKLERVFENPDVSQEGKIISATERENIILKNTVETVQNNELVDSESNNVPAGDDKTSANGMAIGEHGIKPVRSTNERESTRNISPIERETGITEKVSGNGIPDSRSDDTVIKVQQQIENDTLVVSEKNSRESSNVEPLRSQQGIPLPTQSEIEHVKEQPDRESLRNNLEGSQRGENEGKSGSNSNHSGFGHGESESKGEHITLPRAYQFRSMNKTQFELDGTGAFQSMTIHNINTEVLTGEMQQDVPLNNDETVTGIRESVEMTDTLPFNTRKVVNHSERVRDYQGEILDTIVRSARIMTLKGQSSAVIKLEPPNLGHLKLEIVTDRSRVTGKITVESNEVKQLIENRITELRNSLSQNGLKVESFDVQVGHNGGTDAWAQRENIERKGMTSSVYSSVSKTASGMETSEGISSPNRVKLFHNGIFDVWI